MHIRGNYIEERSQQKAYKGRKSFDANTRQEQWRKLPNKGISDEIKQHKRERKELALIEKRRAK